MSASTVDLPGIVDAEWNEANCPRPEFGWVAIGGGVSNGAKQWYFYKSVVLFDSEGNEYQLVDLNKNFEDTTAFYKVFVCTVVSRSRLEDLINEVRRALNAYDTNDPAVRIHVDEIKEEFNAQGVFTAVGTVRVEIITEDVK